MPATVSTSAAPFQPPAPWFNHPANRSSAGVATDGGATGACPTITLTAVTGSAIGAAAATAACPTIILTAPNVQARGGTLTLIPVASGSLTLTPDSAGGLTLTPATSGTLILTPVD